MFISSATDQAGAFRHLGGQHGGKENQGLKKGKKLTSTQTSRSYSPDPCAKV